MSKQKMDSSTILPLSKRRKTKMVVHLPQLPAEIWFMVLCRARVFDLCRIRRVCLMWKEFAHKYMDRITQEAMRHINRQREERGFARKCENELHFIASCQLGIGHYVFARLEKRPTWKKLAAGSAAAGGHKELLRALLSNMETTSRRSVLESAVYAGCFESVEMLIQEDYVKKPFCRALAMAIQCKHKEIMNYLLKKGAYLSKKCEELYYQMDKINA